MQLPHYDDLVPEQLDIYEATHGVNLFVVGPPGSGKTTLAVHRAQMLKRLKKSTLIITKNRMLTALATQLGGGNLKATTMHKLIFSEYKRHPANNVPREGYTLNWPSIMNDYAMHPIPPDYDHIIVDEGQNLPRGFYPWLVQHGGKNVTVFADEAQTTGDASNRASIQDILDAPMPPPLHLHKNHRNTREISMLAEHFHRSAIVAPGSVRAGHSGNVPSLVGFTSWEEVAKRVHIRYVNQNASIGVIVRRVKDIELLYAALKNLQPAIPRLDAYDSSAKRDKEHGIKLLSPGVTILTSESVIGLEFDCVYLQDLHRSSAPLTVEACRKMYMLCARAKNELILLDGPAPMTDSELANLPDEKLLTR